MGPKRFYGSRSKNINICSIPVQADDSELSEDDDNPLETESALSSESEQSGTSDDETTEPGPSTASRILWRPRTSAAETATMEPGFFGKEREGHAPRDPIAYFKDIIDDGILETIITESNRYSLQCDITKPLQLDKDDLERFLGIVFYMSVVNMPRALPIRTDNTGHFPLIVANRGRCKFPECKGFSSMMCKKCTVHLCLTRKSNCFLEFHQP